MPNEKRVPSTHIVFHKKNKPTMIYRRFRMKNNNVTLDLASDSHYRNDIRTQHPRLEDLFFYVITRDVVIT